MSHRASGCDSPRVRIATPIRLATDADGAELVRIVNLAYRVEDFFVSGDRVTHVEIQNRMALENAGFLVVDAPDGSSLAAAVHFIFGNASGFFSLLSVAPEYQRHGLARRLVEEVERLAVGASCGTLELEYVDLREELADLYRKMGFEVTGKRPFPNPGKLLRPAEMIKMSKLL